MDEAAQQAGNRTGARFDSQIRDGEEKAEGYLGTDNQDNQQGQQN